eukprot:GEMP01079368.1.p1 GENE.GEMP01079368.1~~GEMP01079368.1.p1  ORF type:complete len:253 (+),score=50.84 GEMP01079368.1:221-979(+)
MTPKVCCPNSQGLGGLPLCFNEVYTVQRCCGPQARFNLTSEWEGQLEKLLRHVYPMSAAGQIPYLYDVIKDVFVADNDAPLNRSLTLVEIGVWRGNTAQIWLSLLTRDHFHNFTYYMIDPWRHEDSHVENSRISPNDTQHHDNLRATIDTIREWWPRTRVLQLSSVKGSLLFEEEEVDLVFIDGNHFHDAVMEDMEHWWPKVKSGGAMTGHDYEIWGDQPDVKRAVDDFSDRIGVPVEVKMGCWIMRKEAKI